MNLDEKKWAFTEFLGLKGNIENAIHALRDRHILHGSPCNCEDKGEKRFVQYYECNKDVRLLTDEEAEMYNEVAIRFNVLIEYSYLGNNSRDFPFSEEPNFCLMYREWWMG